MSRSDEEILKAVTRELLSRDISKPLSRDELRRLNRAREAVHRKDNYDQFFDDWFQQVAARLGRSTDSLQLLTIEETHHVEDIRDYARDLARKGSIPYFRRRVPLSEEKSLVDLIDVLSDNVPSIPVILFIRRTASFGAIVATSSEVLQNAIDILDRQDYNYVSVTTSDGRTGLSLLIRGDLNASPASRQRPEYEIIVWGDWAHFLAPRDQS